MSSDDHRGVRVFRRLHISRTFVWLLWLAPAVLLTALFRVYPALDAVWLSFFSWPGYGSERYVGLSNYAHLLTDPIAHKAIINTAVFAVVTTVGTVAVGTAAALALDRKFRGAATFRFLIFLPAILPSTFFALVWAAGFDPYFGWANHILGAISPGLSRPWLGDPTTVMFAISAVCILQNTGFPMVIVLSALRQIPRETHEAATIDGVTALQRALLISLPMVRTVVAATALLTLLYGFGTFDYVFVMTNGGPGTASEVVPTFVYHQAFVEDRFGYAAAAAVMTSGIVCLVGLVCLRGFRPGAMTNAN